MIEPSGVFVDIGFHQEFFNYFTSELDTLKRKYLLTLKLEYILRFYPHYSYIIFIFNAVKMNIELNETTKVISVGLHNNFSLPS